MSTPKGAVSTGGPAEPPSSDTRAPKSSRRSTTRGTLWALFPVVLLVAMLVGLGSIAAIAVADPSFAVEQDYYQKAVHWDQSQQQQSDNVRLGWKVTMELEPEAGGALLRVRVLDGDGAALPAERVSVVAFHNARAAAKVGGELRRDSKGALSLRLPLRRSGLWEFRFDVHHSGQRFTQVIRRDFGFSGVTP